jgi:hypothetical protein
MGVFIMPATCKGLCDKWKAKMNNYETKKFCAICSKWRKTKEKYCECCHIQLRIGALRKKLKEKVYID